MRNLFYEVRNEAELGNLSFARWTTERLPKRTILIQYSYNKHKTKNLLNTKYDTWNGKITIQVAYFYKSLIKTSIIHIHLQHSEYKGVDIIFIYTCNLYIHIHIAVCASLKNIAYLKVNIETFMCVCVYIYIIYIIYICTFYLCNLYLFIYCRFI